MARRGVLAAVLAAGRATRFGGGKLDAPLCGRPVAWWVIAALEAAGLEPGVIVTGVDRPGFLQSLVGWHRIVNPAPETGLAGSVAAAAREAERRGAEALLLVLADMPLVEPALLAQLATQPGPAASDHGAGRAGVPALIPAALFGELLESGGDRGAARLLARQPDLSLLAPAPGTLFDIDEPADLGRAEAILRARGHSVTPE